MKRIRKATLYILGLAPLLVFAIVLAAMAVLSIPVGMSVRDESDELGDWEEPISDEIRTRRNIHKSRQRRAG